MKNEQINVIMTEEGLSPSQFANAVGIQRGQVSHLQNNRNRVSLDVVQRIHKAFPHISTEWLLTGAGSYRTESAPVSSAQPADTPPRFVALPASVPGTLFDDLDTEGAAPVSQQQPSARSQPEPLPQSSLASRSSAQSPASRISRPASQLQSDVPHAAAPGGTPSDNYYREDPSEMPWEIPPMATAKRSECEKQPEKSVVEIKIFYSDGTYETFRRS